jgi:hypothetical protein
MPVYKLVTEMPYDEYVKWHLYFGKRPVGWREDDRAMKLMQAQGTKAAPGQVFHSLGVIAAESEKRRNEGNPLDSLRTSALFSRMLGAVGGDVIDA